jgi:hypothetical protein
VVAHDDGPLFDGRVEMLAGQQYRRLISCAIRFRPTLVGCKTSIIKGMEKGFRMNLSIALIGKFATNRADMTVKTHA